MQNALASGERVLNLLETEPDIVDSNDAVEISVDAEPEITFDDVTFSYNDDIKALQNVSFTAKAGEMTAVVGVTGAEKRLLSVLWKVLSARQRQNSLRRGGYKRIQDRFGALKALDGYAGYLSFNGSVAENIAYGVDNATPEQIKAAAVIACADGLSLGCRKAMKRRSANAESSCREDKSSALLLPERCCVNSGNNT